MLTTCQALSKAPGNILLTKAGEKKEKETTLPSCKSTCTGQNQHEANRSKCVTQHSREGAQVVLAAVREGTTDTWTCNRDLKEKTAWPANVVGRVVFQGERASSMEPRGRRMLCGLEELQRGQLAGGRACSDRKECRGRAGPGRPGDFGSNSE